MPKQKSSLMIVDILEVRLIQLIGMVSNTANGRQRCGYKLKRTALLLLVKKDSESDLEVSFRSSTMTGAHQLTPSFSHP